MNTEQKHVRWGIIGPGGIAAKFADACRGVREGCLEAVASRDRARAEAFAARFSIPRVCASYDALLDRDLIDAVYIATPHHAHAEWAQRALERGIAVLCEKPLTVNAAQMEALAALASDKRVLLMEALWTRHLPAVRQARQWMEEGRVGELRHLDAQFGMHLRAAKPEGRMLNPALAGGSLLDLGVYNFSIADFFLGVEPRALHAAAELGPTGVDEHTVVQADYGNGVYLHSCNSLRVRLANAFVLYGSEGTMTLAANFWDCTTVRLDVNGETITKTFPHRVNGFEYQIEAAHEALRAGAIESPVIPHAATLRVLRTMDEIRRQIGLVYPFE
ncbi:MAG TPA: Gfo/Idh/MocA family oxidoreductase [Kiritimatiellia bacterium]|nr:Gfo/Idh/MocA family oxidoreductase [Kiritimatiellia bacterium]